MLVSPFKALHYNPKQIQDLSTVITPPYDVISTEEAHRFRASSPYNFSHLDMLSPGENDHSRAAARLNKWKEVGILSEDPYPSYYLYQQTFEVNGVKRSRRTLICSVLLHDFKAGIVRPHENTHGKHKADRLDQLRHTQSNLSHIFGMVKDPDGFLATRFESWMFHAPFLKTTDSKGIEHVLWRTEGSQAEDIAHFFVKKSIYIVDGHRRYESALAYAREVGALGNFEHPASKTIFAIANVYDKGLVVLPTHRKVKNLNLSQLKRAAVEEKFELSPCSFEDLAAFFAKPPALPQFGLYLWGELFLAMPRDWQDHSENVGPSLAKLPVYWSDEALLKEIVGIADAERSQRVEYEKSAEPLWHNRAENDLIVFHAPPSVEWVTDIADAGKFMPQKSTYFYPKLYAGLTMRSMK